mgnify:CR=1 FL=1
MVFRPIIYILIFCSSCAGLRSSNPSSDKISINLSQQGLHEVPNELKGNVTVKVLKLYGNKLTELPEWICELESLEKLYIGKNQLKALPQSIGNLKNLKLLIIQQDVKCAYKDFENTFKKYAGPTKQASEPVDERLREAASLVLDIHDKASIMESADELLDKISTEGIAAPLTENQSLEMKPLETSLTSRKDPSNLANNNLQQVKEIQKSVPLPKAIDDDLDL